MFFLKNIEVEEKGKETCEGAYTMTYNSREGGKKTEEVVSGQIENILS